MAKRPSKKDENEIGIVEAVETLSNIADLDFDADIGVTKKHHIVIQDKELTYRTVHWMTQDESTTTVRAIRDTFAVVLNYLREFYKLQYSPADWKETEGVKNLMVLVGDAAKKLDRYTSLFKQKQSGSVTDLKEYKQLQTFYQNKIAKDESDRGRMEKLFSSTVTPMAEEIETHRRSEKSLDPNKTFVDFESVKKDTEYELFFLRKEGTKRFYNQRLIRNMKLICDFGGSFGARDVTDPLVNIGEWQDRMFHIAACDILDAIEIDVERFYQLAAQFRNRDLVILLNNAVMALYLCRNAHNLERRKPPKNCQGYFHDFQEFLRAAMNTTDYQHNLVYHPARSNRVDTCLMELAHSMCLAMYTRIRGHREILKIIQGLIRNEGSDEGPKRSLGVLLRKHEEAFRSIIGRHPNGPLFKVLETLEGKITADFDPILQGNMPHHLFDLFVGDNKYAHIRFACPTKQNVVSEAEIIPEFKGFLRSYAKHPLPKRHLLINLQDRTSWKEHARSHSLEHLPKVDEFTPELTVVTIPKSTDFYHQLPPYSDLNEAKEFKASFIEHIRGDASGFYIEKRLRGELLGAFVDKSVEGIHELFFGGRDTLTVKERLNFIELFYLLFQMKTLETVDPSSFSLSCKDSVDAGAAATATMYGFLELIDEDVDLQEILVNIELFLFEPALMIRERDIQPEPFERVISLLELVETMRDKGGGITTFRKRLQKVFGKLFKHPVFTPHVGIPRRRHHAISSVSGHK